MKSKSYLVEKGKLELHSSGGNLLTGAILKASGSQSHFIDFQERRSGSISDHDILMTMTGLLCNGRSDFNDVELYRNNDSLFAHSYGIKDVPSEATLRQRLDEFPRGKAQESIRSFNTKFLSQRSLGEISVGVQKFIPVDMDVSPFDNSGSHKQRVSMTYKKHEGFAPMFSYVGAEGYMLDCELREGSQHCQKDTPSFIARNLEILRNLGVVEKCLFRLDGGNDAAQNWDHLLPYSCIIKRNMRKECPEQWLALAKRVGEERPTRLGKRIWVGWTYHLHPGNDQSRANVPVVFEVIERTTDNEGHPYVMPMLEVNTWWANKIQATAQEVIETYHAHGTSEQYHSELKTDMDVERLPSGKFCVNELVLLCAMLAFNTLRCLGQEAVSRKDKAPVRITVSRWRIKSVLKNIVYTAVRIVRHANRVRLVFGKNCPWFDIIKDISLAYP